MAESADHITCQEVVELVNDYLKRALPPGETTVFEQHLNFCDGCDLYVEQLRRTVETVGEIREEDVPAEAKERLLERLPRLETLVIAYKFLRDDATGVFTGFAWPLPEEGPGAWVEARVEQCRSVSTRAAPRTFRSGRGGGSTKSSWTATSSRSRRRLSRRAGGLYADSTAGTDSGTNTRGCAPIVRTSSLSEHPPTGPVGRGSRTIYPGGTSAARLRGGTHRRRDLRRGRLPR